MRALASAERALDASAIAGTLPAADLHRFRLRLCQERALVQELLGEGARNAPQTTANYAGEIGAGPDG
jgi:hypothetical protein